MNFPLSWTSGLDRKKIPSSSIKTPKGQLLKHSINTKLNEYGDVKVMGSGSTCLEFKMVFSLDGKIRDFTEYRKITCIENTAFTFTDNLLPNLTPYFHHTSQTPNFCKGPGHLTPLKSSITILLEDFHSLLTSYDFVQTCLVKSMRKTTFLCWRNFLSYSDF